MLPDFGVGLHRFFFEPMYPTLFEKVRSRITDQVKIYMPFLTIRSVSFIDSEEDSMLNANSLYVKIRYSIPALHAEDELQLTVNSHEF